MKKIISITAAVLLTACTTTKETTFKATQSAYDQMLTLKPHVYDYNPENDIRIDMTITTIEQTYFTTDENIQSWYYTVYATDNSGNIYCICDDLEIDNIAGYEFMLILGDKVMLIYEKGKPECTGKIISLNDWNN